MSFGLYTFEVRWRDRLEQFVWQDSLRLSDFAAGMRNSRAKQTKDWRDASIELSPHGRSVFISFPSQLSVKSLGETLFEAKEAQETRVKLLLSTGHQNFEFEFPHGEKVEISWRRAKKEDLRVRLAKMRPLGLAIAAHLSIGLIMVTSLSLSKAGREFLPDVSQMSASVFDLHSSQPVGVTPMESSGPSSKSLMKSLDSLLKSKPKASGKRFEGIKVAEGSKMGAGQIGKLSFSGASAQSKPLDISEEQVSIVFHKVTPRLKECYDDVLIRDSSLQGRPQLVVSVDAKGRVEGVSVRFISGKSSSLEILTSCFKQSFKSAQFPQANQSFAVTQTLVLTR